MYAVDGCRAGLLGLGCVFVCMFVRACVFLSVYMLGYVCVAIRAFKQAR